MSAQQRRRALAHLLGDEPPRILARQEFVEPGERLVEQRVVALVLGQHVEHLRRGAGHVGLAQPRSERAAEKRAYALVLHGFERVGDQARRVSRDASRRSRA